MGSLVFDKRNAKDNRSTYFNSAIKVSYVVLNERA